MKEQLMGKKVAMVLANNFEDSEAIDPKNHLESLGAEVVTIGETRGTVEGKQGGSICHGPQLLISARVLDGRTVTSVKKIRDDVMNAGANYVDEPLVIDGNLITSRVPGDLPQFNEALGQAIGLGKEAPALVG